MALDPIYLLPVGAHGIDYYSAGSVDLHAIHRDGLPLPDGTVAPCSFIVRYECEPPSDPAKRITPAEVALAHELGMAVLIVWEMNGTRALGSYSLGRHDGITAAQHCAALGLPTACAIIAAVDFFPSSAQRPTVLAYLRGFADGLALLGYPEADYDGTDDLEAALAAGIPIRWGWQAAAGSWSHVPSSHVAIQQLVPGSRPNYDLNVVRQPTVAWLPHDVPDPKEPPVAKLVQVVTPAKDPAIFVEWSDGTMSSAIDGTRIAALAAAGTVPSPTPTPVDRGYLALFRYDGPLPAYGPVDPAQPGRTVLTDFRPAAPAATPACSFPSRLTLSGGVTGVITPA